MTDPADDLAPPPADEPADALDEALGHGPDHGLGDAPVEDLRTGDPLVDAVLDSLHGMEERPVEEHVTVFERAHEDLRRALDAATGTPPESGPDSGPDA